MSDRVGRDKGKTPFLKPGASTAELIRAAAMNHRRWFAARAVNSGGEVRTEYGVMRTITSDEVILAFPRLASAEADRVLDEIVADCRRRKPRIVGAWATTPTFPRDLGVRLTARGFSWGWQPHWMAMDFRNLPADYKPPQGLNVAVDDVCDWDVEDLPYYSRESETGLRLLSRRKPRRVWHFGAWLEGQVVGHSILYLTTGALGVAGIYNVGVLPAFRRRGIGRALMMAICEFSRDLGCHYALLNSAASEFYASIGFDSHGWGQTWWMHAHTMAAPPPEPVLVDFVTALGRGDLRALNRLDRSALPSDFDLPLFNGMTPLEVATRSGKPAAAEWLLQHGATLDVRDAWDLGWKNRIPALLAENPDLVNRKAGQWQITPLHEAVSRDDVEFARLLLAFHPDLNIKDTEYNSTPLGWARHMGRTEIVTLLEQHIAGL